MSQAHHKPLIALGSRLKGMPGVLTLGVRPNFHDYTSREKDLMLEAPVVLYPTQNYAQFFHTLGKRIFPSLETHLYADEKIKQTTLFYMLNIPHPRTRIYYGLHHGDILEEFSFPFIAKLPRASSQGRGVFMVRNKQELQHYLNLTKVAYIQEYLPHDRDIRVVLINYEPILAYWREVPPGGFRSNLFQGGTANFAGIPEEILELAQAVATRCKFDDVGLDFILHEGVWYLIEANMKYGRKALKERGLDLKMIIRDVLLSMFH
ncbi:MAG: ATP-grasp domain-containing protein [Deltaproteobacteria bacterium]|nr:ATP-grasp domain-containing protein [Deltaproteobacteria bacterium]MBW2136094.1 ATP-grasp domain-containing protein [Deltaproteobacteria bacterium]